MLARKPVNVSFEQAAVVPVSAITALQGLRDVGRVEQGRRERDRGIDRQLRALALSLFVRQRLTMFIAKERSSDLERLTDLIEAGTVTPSIDK